MTDLFLHTYVQAALWSSMDESTPGGRVPLGTVKGSEDLAPETLAAMRADCERFQAENEADLAGGELERAGYDFWLTRNGHGCGFWDGDWPEPQATRLTEASKQFGEFNLYVGDDGKIHHT